MMKRKGTLGTAGSQESIQAMKGSGGSTVTESICERFGDSGEAGWARLGVSATLVKVLADMVEHAMKGDGEGPGDAVESAPRVGAKGGSAT